MKRTRSLQKFAAQFGYEHKNRSNPFSGIKKHANETVQNCWTACFPRTKTTKKNHKKEAKQMKNSPTEVKKKETEERKRQEELEKQKRNETYQLLGGSQNDSDADDDSSLDGNIQQLENYSYLTATKFLNP